MELINLFKKFLAAEQLFFKESHSNNSMILMRTKGRNGEFNSIVQVFENKNSLICITEIPIEVSKGNILQVLQVITHLNNELLFTTILYDYNENKIKLKSVITLDNKENTTGLFKFLLYTNIGTVDYYIPILSSQLMKMDSYSQHKNVN